jgi:hypothetical protein
MFSGLAFPQVRRSGLEQLDQGVGTIRATDGCEEDGPPCVSHRENRAEGAIDVADWERRHADGVLVVHNAGEMLYRAKDVSPTSRA